MSWFLKARDYVRRPGEGCGNDPRRVRAIPGGVPRSPLEWRVQEILAAHPICAWDDLVAEVARYLRGSERPSVLTSLDEGLWGGWVWPALAREELHRQDGILLAIEAPPSSMAGIPRPAPSRQLGSSGDLSAVHPSPASRGWASE